MLKWEGKRGSAGLECGAEPRFTWETVEGELVEAVKLSWRLPSGGASSFATDGPWQWLTRLARASAGATDRPGAAEWELLRNEIDTQHMKDARNTAATSPLTAREVDWMDERLAWLLLVPERDRKLVWVALVQIASARGRFSWNRVRERLQENRRWREVAISNRGLGARYSRAIGAIAKALDDGKVSAAA